MSDEAENDAVEDDGALVNPSTLPMEGKPVEMTFVLRRPMLLTSPDKATEAGTLIGKISVRPDISQHWLADAIRNGVVMLKEDWDADWDARLE